jgi:hypothetical protein
VKAESKNERRRTSFSFSNKRSLCTGSSYSLNQPFRGTSPRTRTAHSQSAALFFPVLRHVRRRCQILWKRGSQRKLAAWAVPSLGGCETERHFVAQLLNGESSTGTCCCSDKKTLLQRIHPTACCSAVRLASYVGRKRGVKLLKEHVLNAKSHKRTRRFWMQLNGLEEPF